MGLSRTLDPRLARIAPTGGPVLASIAPEDAAISLRRNAGPAARASMDHEDARTGGMSAAQFAPHTVSPCLPFPASITSAPSLPSRASRGADSEIFSFRSHP